MAGWDGIRTEDDLGRFEYGEGECGRNEMPESERWRDSLVYVSAE